MDEFYSTAEGQKIEMRALQQERDALKKLDNIRKDHDQRLLTLEKTQDADRQKAEMITRNQELVDKAILAVQSALANQVSTHTGSFKYRGNRFEMFCIKFSESD